MLATALLLIYVIIADNTRDLVRLKYVKTHVVKEERLYHDGKWVSQYLCKDSIGNSVFLSSDRGLNIGDTITAYYDIYAGSIFNRKDTSVVFLGYTKP